MTITLKTAADAAGMRVAGRLAELLRYGDPYAGPVEGGALVVVAPRLGTVSPWASKATDIAHNCGLPIARVERVTEYHLTLKSGVLGGTRALTADQLAAAAALLHDRMTESVLAQRGDARHLFDEQVAAPLRPSPRAAFPAFSRAARRPP